MVREELQIDLVRNEEIAISIPLKDYLADDQAGIFRGTARDANHRWRHANLHLMITDLGIMAKETRDELWVWVNSLSSLKPIANAEVKLITQTNHITHSGTTDDAGLGSVDISTGPYKSGDKAEKSKITDS